MQGPESRHVAGMLPAAMTPQSQNTVVSHVQQKILYHSCKNRKWGYLVNMSMRISGRNAFLNAVIQGQSIPFILCLYSPL